MNNENWMKLKVDETKDVKKVNINTDTINITHGLKWVSHGFKIKCVNTSTV